jgi:uncharacterized protein YabN with tetrapyrrole methylase and pyrophosphatase domain
MLRYAHERGCPWDEYTCSEAAGRGHLEVLRYAHEHGCPWDERTCEEAVGGGHLEVLRYAHEHGCPWDKEACSEACSEAADADKPSQEASGPVLTFIPAARRDAQRNGI